MTEPARQFASKTALVTGASRGIGSAIAQQLCAEGCRVVVGYSQDRRGAEATLRRIRSAGGEAEAFKADVSDPEAATRLVAYAAERFERLDMLINNAGAGANQLLEDLDWLDVERQVGTNMLGPFATIKAAAPHLRKTKGLIVNISSLNARSPAPSASVYSATKAALEALTKSLARELGPRGIRVNCVAPGLIATRRRLAKLSPDARREVVAATPLGRLGTPQDVAKVVVFLSSEGSAWITGQTIAVDGGYGI